MAKKDTHTEWHLQSGQYLGEISALCFLHLPSQFSPFPILIAGSGSEILLYNLESGKIIKSFQIFQGIRVHGISLFSYTELAFELVVFGEKRVKLYRLNVDLVDGLCVDFIPLCSLPKFNHWVLDVCFFKSCGDFSRDCSGCIAIGCSDNSVHVWDTAVSRMILHVESPERCLLYSMRMWGDDIETLRVASGTIFNEIIVWEVVPQSRHIPSTSTKKDHDEKSNHIQPHLPQYEAVQIIRLVGHEGSIFRIAWSSDGSKLVSVSDDRSARIWVVNAERKDPHKPGEVTVLFGHNARVWDCCIYNSLIITAGEDCSCRAWGLDGEQLEMIKEHIGRGVWRCLYDPVSSLLITAGFDSAIKVHQLQTSLSRSSEVTAEITNCSKIFTSCIPNSSGRNGLTDSKSEYVRCLKFTSEFTLYVATNRGYLYHAMLSDTNIMDVIWTELVRVSEEVPIVCMDLLSSSSSKVFCGAEDWIALGDGQGKMTVLKVLGDSYAPKLHVSFNWAAEIERQLLGTFWCKSLGHRYIFTANPRGVLKLWRLYDHASSPTQNSGNVNVSLIAEYISCFGTRIMCLDASFEEEILVCGDVRGNLILFPLSKDLLLGRPITSGVKIIPTCYFKGAHGISTVTSVGVPRFESYQTEIHSTGGDGCICHMEYIKDRKVMEFIGMRQVKELSSVQSLSRDQNSAFDFTSNLYAAGFASADFIIWNLITEAKVLQIQCGGWRRPHSYYLGDVPERKNCFAYVKDEVIYVHRYWVSANERKIFPQNLHVQFHGRELHSLCFVTEDFRPKADSKHDILSRSSWIVTGCEDGTVRLTRYTPGIDSWSASNLLGEHVGGSAVRSICYVSKIHLIASDVATTPDKINVQESDSDDSVFLLISAGAKRVLTSWLRKHGKLEKMKGTNDYLQHNGKVRHDPSSGLSSSISFKWLSTDMPAKFFNSDGNSYDARKTEVEAACNINADAGSKSLQENKEPRHKSYPKEKYEDDWRYLAVTAFLVKYSNSRFTVCFIVVACSDATLSLRALILPHRLWFDVASLIPVPSPVLALQHIVFPKFHPNGGETLVGGVYIVISGSTDGSIAFWDLTGSIEAFMKRLSSLHEEMLIDFQKRPRTGRGSQGGRRRRSLSSVTKRRPTKEAGEETNLNTQNQFPCESSSKVNISEGNTSCSEPVCSTSFELGLSADNLSSEMCEIQPIHVLSNVHQSGVNCLHVSAVNNSECFNNYFMYNVISGGDDQALQCLTLDLSLLLESPNSEILRSESESIKTFMFHSQDYNHKYMLRFLDCHRIASAHSSAIKGVWTDGVWVFSTGLDQRIRCWKLEEQKLVEYAYLITTVPEPEAIDARACDRNHYQIAVAGRGMQIIEFSTSCGVGRSE